MGSLSPKSQVKIIPALYLFQRGPVCVQGWGSQCDGMYFNGIVALLLLKDSQRESRESFVEACESITWYKHCCFLLFLFFLRLCLKSVLLSWLYQLKSCFLFHPCCAGHCDVCVCVRERECVRNETGNTGVTFLSTAVNSELELSVWEKYTG